MQKRSWREQGCTRRCVRRPTRGRLGCADQGFWPQPQPLCSQPSQPSAAHVAKLGHHLCDEAHARLALVGGGRLQQVVVPAGTDGACIGWCKAVQARGELCSGLKVGVLHGPGSAWSMPRSVLLLKRLHQLAKPNSHSAAGQLQPAAHEQRMTFHLAPCLLYPLPPPAPPRTPDIPTSLAPLPADRLTSSC